MPRPGPPRAIVGVRMSQLGINQLDILAATYSTDARQLKRSDIVRGLMSLAITQGIPKDWQP